ncbi:MAG: TRAP transporter small permease [Pseudomonadota bacterium]
MSPEGIGGAASEAAAQQLAAEAANPSARSWIAALSRSLSLALLWFAGCGLVVITLIVLWQVFARYVLNASPSWSEQLALFILVWSVIAGAAAGVREGFHIRITAAQDALAGKGRTVARIVAHGITALIGLFLAVYGTSLVASLWSYSIPTLGLPRGSAFLPLPLAGVTIVFFSGEHIGALLSGKEVTPLWR